MKVTTALLSKIIQKFKLKLKVRGAKENKPTKIQIVPLHFPHEWFGHKTSESICFQKDFMKN